MGILFQSGFRIFFLAAAIHALLSVNVWLLIVMGYQISLPMTPLFWHSHEMFFGFTLAVISGFLLTAVKNWTGLETAKGKELFFLFFLWLLGRICFLFNFQNPACLAIDLLYVPVFMFFVMRPILKTKNTRNYSVGIALLAMFVSNIFYHLNFWQIYPQGAQVGYKIFLVSTLFFIFLIGGRIIPFFSGNIVKSYKHKSHPLVERLIAPSLLMFGMCEIFWPMSLQSAVFSLFVFLIHAKRFLGWWNKEVLKMPILGILYLGYVLTFLGFLINTLSYFWKLPPHISIHTFTIGGIGVFTLGMMTRVALGHTGRRIHASKFTVIAYACMFFAFLLRVIGVAVKPQLYLNMVHYSGGLWDLAMVFYLLSYASILCQPRQDGRPG